MRPKAPKINKWVLFHKNNLRGGAVAHNCNPNILEARWEGLGLHSGVPSQPELQNETLSQKAKLGAGEVSSG